MYSRKPKTDPEVKALRDVRAQLLRDRRQLIRTAREVMAKIAINGSDLNRKGHITLKKLQHPFYLDCVEPLLNEARRMCLMAGFDLLYQTRTPLPGNPGEPNFTEAIVGVHGDPTPTFQKCLDAIAERPTLNIPLKQPGEQLSAEQPQLAVSDNSSTDKASE